MSELTMTDTVRLSSLITSTMIGANNRGHSIIRSVVHAEGYAELFCERCGREAQCMLWPAPNGIDVSGELVGLGCLE